MKKLLLLFVVALSVSFAAYAQENNTPEGVAQQFLDATIAGDKDAAFALCLEQKDMPQAEKDFDEAHKVFKESLEYGAEFRVGIVTIDGNNAEVEIVMVMNGQNLSSIPMLLVKEGGIWKVDQEAEVEDE